MMLGVVLLRPLTVDDLAIVEGWFGDPATARFLGGPEWPREALRLQAVVVGETVAGVTTTHRRVFVAFEDDADVVGLIDVEVYNNRTASAAFVVAPNFRRRGLGQAILKAVEGLSILQDVDAFVGGVEAHNEASIGCLRGAGYTIAGAPDDQGFLAVHKELIHPG